MPSWDRYIYEKDKAATTTTETRASPSLLDPPQVISDAPANLITVINTSSSKSLHFFDGAVLKLIVLPNTTLSLSFPISFTNSLQVNNTGITTVDYTVQYVRL